ncbi:spermidine/putrescine ABC transporter permease PotC, partial [Enterobacter mori]
ARKGISMEINAISTILFVVIMMGVLGYYVIQSTLMHKRLLKRGIQR